jgi:hypothetical protein
VSGGLISLCFLPSLQGAFLCFSEEEDSEQKSKTAPFLDWGSRYSI